MADAVVNTVVAVGAAVVCLLIEEEEAAKRKARKRRSWMRRWCIERNDQTQRNTFYKFHQELLRMDDVDEFRATLRMPPDIYAELLELVRPYITKMDTNYRKAISAEERLSLTMRYLALGEHYRMLRHRVGLITVGRIIRETSDGLYKALQPQYLVTPSTEDAWRSVAEGFLRRWNFPHVLGALDGKHVRMTCPPGSGSYFYNYKLYYSIILLALVDSNYEFLFVDIGAEGRCSDGGVWKRSSLLDYMSDENNPLNLPPAEPFEGVQGNIPYFLISDAAFPMTDKLLKPYPSIGADLSERIYNYRLSRARMVVENSFGILSTRFRIYRREIEMLPPGAEKVVMATVVLHNFLRRKCKH